MPTSAPAVAAPADEPVNILLVDDEPRNLMVLESILENPGYRLVMAESGDQALLALVASEFAVIVLDIRMPGMNGFELAQMIKRRPKSALIPIIFLTAHYSEDRHILEGYGTGAVDYLHKPVNAVILRSKVAVFAELYRKSRESLSSNRALTLEVAERRRVQDEMRGLQDELERRVEERTSELLSANQALQQIQRELKEADRRKDQFLAMLGHELRNPLAPIRNAVSILKKLVPDQPELIWCRDVIDRQTGHLTHLVDDLLDVSRVSRGKIQIEKRIVDLADAVHQAVEICRPLIDSRRHDLKLSLPAAPLLVEGDITRLAQVVANLINNAAKYTDEGGLITVAVQAENGGGSGNAVVRVRDNGRGLDSESLANLFQLFYQADTNLDRSDGGLGVGLALVRSLVELHGGTVEASSPGRGQGSEFIICLPRATREAKHEPPAPPPPAAAGLRVLVVDDNCDAAKSLAMMLKILGHTASMAHAGVSAVEMAMRDRPDVILLDIGLPGMNGYEVCRSLRQQGLKNELILAVTGYGQESDRQLAREAGFDMHLVKPVSLPVIQKLLAERASANRA
ncbi:MAG: response regulator [Planctomycetia bacterium]|nr:response regulator [Planctomycetia bacterium]